jgi:RNA polymerase sigma-70 factor (ECF subfamily)
MVNTNPDNVSQILAERPLDDLTDEELVTAHLDGRPGAFQRLYDRYRDRLIHFITRKTGDADRAQDLVQEAFIRVTRHLHRFDTTKKFSTWVYTIAGNLSKNELRNRSRSPLVLFQRLTGNWDDDHRPIQLEGKSYEEISKITGVNLGTVKSRLHRARNSFAQRIEPHLN